MKHRRRPAPAFAALRHAPGSFAARYAERLGLDAPARGAIDDLSPGRRQQIDPSKAKLDALEGGR